MCIRGVCSQVNRYQMAKVGIGLFAVTSVIFSSFLIARVFSGNFPKSLDAKWLRDLKDHLVVQNRQYGLIGLLPTSLSISAVLIYIYRKRKEKIYAELLSAALFGDLAEVRSLLQKGVKVNVTNNHGQTALMRAAAAGSLDVVRFLLENGAELVEPDHFQKTALMYAAENGHREVVDLLLEEGKKPGKYDIFRVTQYSSPKELVLEGAGIDRAKRADVERRKAQGDKNHALQSAAARGRIEVMQFLLDKGASLRSGRGSTSSPLTRASAAGHVEGVIFLLDQEVHHDIKPYDLDDQKNHDYALMAAAENDPLMAAAENDPLMAAAENDHLEVVRLLLKRGADITAVDYRGRTPIIIAAEARHVEVVRLLLAQEDSIGIEEEKDNGRDEEEYFDKAPAINHDYALMAAAGRGYVEVVRLLLEKGVGAADIFDPHAYTAAKVIKDMYLGRGEMVAANAIDPHAESKLEISSIFTLVHGEWSKAKAAKEAAKEADYANILKLFIEHGIKLPEDYKQCPKIVELIEERKKQIQTRTPLPDVLTELTNSFLS